MIDDAGARRVNRMRHFSLARVIIYLCLVPIIWGTHMQGRVSIVMLLSIWALVEPAFASWRADDNPDLKRILKSVERVEQMMEEMLTAQGELLTSQANIVERLPAKRTRVSPPKPRA